MGPIGMQEMVVIFLVALVLFGPKKLPELGKTIAKAMTEFRRAQSDLKATYEREMATLERETASLREETRTAVEAITASYSEQDITPYMLPSETPEHPTVSASAVSGAESPVEPQSAPYTATHDEAVTAVTLGVEGTVPRSASGSTTMAAETASHPDESNPLPEFEQRASGPAAKSAEEELPSIV